MPFDVCQTEVVESAYHVSIGEFLPISPTGAAMKNLLGNFAKPSSSCSSLVLMIGLAYGLSLMGGSLIYPDQVGSTENQNNISNTNKAETARRSDMGNIGHPTATGQTMTKHADTEAAISPGYE
jgi:hypothetical protein